MNISGNTADKAGQSLYVASTELQKWCNQGTLGQYVKRNYSEALSNIDEYEGILVDQSELAKLTQEDILEQQYHLEYFWSEIVALTKVDVTINQSNTIKIDFNQAGQISITDSQFKNIAKIGNNVDGGALKILLEELFVPKSQIQMRKLNQHQHNSYNAMHKLEEDNIQQLIKEHLPQKIHAYLKKAKLIHEMGGGIYVDIDYSTSAQPSFMVKDALIQNCWAVTSFSSSVSTGYGGGTFVVVQGYVVPPLMSIGLKGMKIYGNVADNE
ncbi:MAG: hypothetical protein EZS28_040945 [Streblomastix strix]|uniref:Uncharacterized protein n=1 Tax=Streblomastix strix TaxID=222440 RepID=A0A5J4TZX8_9EUKA|nr:MAG: hypothetical protein EZS28_040945 [Streblomastix strix]